jgi:uncharacterized membrane protein YhdT
MTKCIVISLCYIALIAILVFVVFNEVTRDKNDE